MQLSDGTFTESLTEPNPSRHLDAVLHRAAATQDCGYDASHAACHLGFLSIHNPSYSPWLEN